MSPSDTGFCPNHGQTELRWHRNKNYRLKGRWVCLPCHRKINLARYKKEESQLTHKNPAIPCCEHSISYQNETFVCVRPQGHPLDVHRSADNVTWKVRTRRAA